MPELPGLHDLEAAGWLASTGCPGWILATEELGADPNNRSGQNYAPVAAQGITVIARLNYSHHGQGTLPTRDRYADFAQRCANFVAASPGCSIWIIGNEPNHAQEQPQGQPITPQDYAECYRRCRSAIKRLPGHAHDQVLVAGPAPWNGDWLQYFAAVAVLTGDGCDGYSLHAYCHGSDPALASSEFKVHSWRWHFRTFLDQLAKIPARLRRLPVYITESNQGDQPWENVNRGFVQALYAEIHRHNQAPGVLPVVRCLILYRWSKADEQAKWAIMDKDQVQADLRAAIDRHYPSPGPEQTGAPPVSEKPTPAQPPTSSPQGADWPPNVLWDSELTQRGVEVITPPLTPGQKVWIVIHGEHRNEQESQGRRHIYVDVRDEAGNRLPGVPLRVTWPDGDHTITSEAKPGEEAAANYPVTPGRFTIQVNDGTPSEIVHGLGMGEQTPDGWNAGIHASQFLIFQRLTVGQDSGQPLPPAQPPAKPPAPPLFKAGAVVYTQTTVNLRRSVGYRNKPANDVIRELPPGTGVTLGQRRAADGLHWYSVQDSSGPAWIAERDPTGTPLLTAQRILLQHPIPNAQQRRISQGWGGNRAYYQQFEYDGVPLLGHNGIDYATPIGTPVAAVDAGRVLKVENEAAGFGLHVLLGHKWGESLYAHLHSTSVNAGQPLRVGDLVDAGQIVGLTGASGQVSGAHLHFGLRLAGYSRADGWGGFTDPLPYLAAAPAPVQPPAPRPQPPRAGYTTAQLITLLADAAQEFGLPWQLMVALAWHESNFDTEIESSTGALGLCQIQPDTWAEWTATIDAGPDITDPHQNARVGAAYLAYLVRHFGDRHQGLLAYNWGMGYLMEAKEVPPLKSRLFAFSVGKAADLLVALSADRQAAAERLLLPKVG